MPSPSQQTPQPQQITQQRKVLATTTNTNNINSTNQQPIIKQATPIATTTIPGPAIIPSAPAATNKVQNKTKTTTNKQSK